MDTKSLTFRERVSKFDFFDKQIVLPHFERTKLQSFEYGTFRMDHFNQPALLVPWEGRPGEEKKSRESRESKQEKTKRQEETASTKGRRKRDESKPECEEQTPFRLQPVRE